MSTWIACYVSTDDTGKVLDELTNLTGLIPGETGALPDNFDPHFTDALPDRMAISCTQPGWITILYNSFSKLEDWAITLSENMRCRVVVIMAQNTSDSYYFACYDSGRLTREIETCYSEDAEMVNAGEPFGFEEAEPGIPYTSEGETTYLFDMDAIELYCSRLGFNALTSIDQTTWTMLQKKGSRASTTVAPARKPWWKFW